MSKPLSYARHSVSEDDISAVVSVLRSEHLTQGPTVPKLEAAICEYVGSKYCVAVSNGTVALELAYKASGATRVRTSPLTFAATANAAERNALALNFADVDGATGNVEQWPWDTHGLFVPVHYAGRAATIPGGFVVEDAAQALGAMDFDGCSRVGSCAHSLATTFSLHPSKPIAAGEGGLVTTNDQGFADEVRSLRDHGRENGEMVRLGTNGRMDEMSAALALSQLKRCDEMRERRAELVQAYIRESARVGIVLQSPDEFYPAGEKTSHHLFPIRVTNDRREEVKAKLAARGIQTQVHYKAVHLQPYYKSRFGFKEGDFPEAEAWSAEELSLPLFASMSESDVVRVVDALREALA